MNGQTQAERAAWCKAMREFVDMVESDPVIPVPDSVDIWTHLWPGESSWTQAQRIAAVHDFAERFGAQVRALGKQPNRQVSIAVGEIKMNVHSYPQDDPGAPRSKVVRFVSRADDAALLAEAVEIGDEALDEHMQGVGDQGTDEADREPRRPRRAHNPGVANPDTCFTCGKPIAENDGFCLLGEEVDQAVAMLDGIAAHKAGAAPGSALSEPRHCASCGSTVYVVTVSDGAGDLVDLCRDCHQGPHLDVDDGLDGDLPEAVSA